MGLGQRLQDLADRHPATQSQLFGADGQLNRYVNVYLNDEDVRVLDGLGTAVEDISDEEMGSFPDYEAFCAAAG